VGLRGRLRRLERLSEGPVVVIPQPDGTVARFPESELAPAFLNAVARATRPPWEQPPEHPLVTAARASTNTRWRGSVVDLEPAEGEVPDLSE
jgi:hypothetical protein